MQVQVQNLKELEVKISSSKEKLNQILEANDFNFKSLEVVFLSEELDQLILNYIMLTKE